MTEEKITYADVTDGLPDFEPDELPEDEDGFKITDDAGAEWALRKIREAEDEEKRLTSLYTAELTRINAALLKITERTNSTRAYFNGLLRRYFETVPHTRTKAGTEQYKLLTGTLAMKPAAPKFVPDKERLLAWLEKNGREDLIKTERSPKWAEVKKGLTYAAGCAVDENGEIVDGVEAVVEEPVFTIKL